MPRRPHTCHLPGCRTRCPPAHLFCRQHWAMVPPDIQREVYATVRQRDMSGVDETWAPWWRAQAQATVAVLRKLYPEQEDRIARYEGKEMRFAGWLEGERCDGDHPGPACPDPECWHRDPKTGKANS